MILTQEKFNQLRDREISRHLEEQKAAEQKRLYAATIAKANHSGCECYGCATMRHSCIGDL